MKRLDEPNQQIQREEPIKKHKKALIGEKLTRNIAIATLALLCVVSAKDVYVGDKTALQAVQGALQGEWDQNVGKLTYVSNFLSDSMQVFGTPSGLTALTSPVTAKAAQVFSQGAPYLVFEGAQAVFAAADGEVMSVAHTDDETYVVRVRHDDRTETLYYGLNSCLVAEGAEVNAGTRLGDIAKGGELAFEARLDGLPVDASAYLRERK